MQITSTLTFSATPDQVAVMMVDPGFSEHVGSEIHANNVTTSLLDQGLTTVFTLDTPESARRIIGAQMTVTETVTWQAAPVDGVRTGRMTITVAGMPAQADGPLRVGPDEAGATMVYQSDFTVRIPLVGKKIEQLAEKHISRIMKACEKVGNAWLSRED